LLADQGFLRGYLRAAAYVPVFEGHRLQFRGEIGAISADATAGIPSKFLFRTGGSQTVRGYEFESLGPRLADATVGGKYLAVLSAEYLHSFTHEWAGVAFYDAGNATNDWESLRLAKGYGAGVRWKSPVGPVGLDVAYGELDSKVRAYFAIGFRF
ncbi:MAG TPA: BamA/TamA family outer membrane protein, partial [Burkholderiales bacterium]